MFSEEQRVFPRTYPQGEFPVKLSKSRRGGVGRRRRRRRRGEVGGEERWNVRAKALCLIITQPGREGGGGGRREGEKCNCAGK